MATLDNDDKKWLKDNFVTKTDLKSELNQTEKRIKQYIHEGVDAVVEGVDNLLNEQQLDSRIKKLEKATPN